jgi:hypothetical protein
MWQWRVAMSLNALADEEVARAKWLRQSPSGDTATVTGPPTTGVIRTGEPPQSGRRDPTAASNALVALARYIPAEIVTLYVAALSAMPAFSATFALVTEVRLYWFFVGLTPVLLLLVLAGKRRSEGFSVFPPWKEWPWWKLIASTIAFLVWALAIPGTPYLLGAQGKVVAAFGALLVSTFLTLLEPIFEPSRSRKPQAVPKPPLRGEDFKLE